MSTELSRSNRIGRNFDVLLWVQSREKPFCGRVMAQALEISTRSALRYLRSLEARDVVTSDRASKPWLWASTFTAEAK